MFSIIDYFICIVNPLRSSPHSHSKNSNLNVHVSAALQRFNPDEASSSQMFKTKNSYLSVIS